MNRSFALLTRFCLPQRLPDLRPQRAGRYAAVQEADQPAQLQSRACTARSARKRLFALLTAELAGQRNRFDIALTNYVQQARKRGDAGVSPSAPSASPSTWAPSRLRWTAALIWASNAPDKHRRAARCRRATGTRRPLRRIHDLYGAGAAAPGQYPLRLPRPVRRRYRPGHRAGCCRASTAC